MLPTYVALFDEQIADYKDPMQLHRYALAKMELDSGAYILKQFGEDIDCIDIHKEGGSSVIGVVTMRAMVLPNITRHTIVWKTGWQVSLQGYDDIPVILIEYLDITRGCEYYSKPRGDLLNISRDRQQEQREYRLDMMSSARLRDSLPKYPAIDSPIPRPVHPLGVLTIPRFAANIMKKDKISREESCAISMIPFSEVRTVVLTSCFHLFDVAAFYRWMEVKRECPICKQTVTACMTI